MCWRGNGIPTQVRVLTGRSLRAAFADPRLVFFGLLQPVVMLLLFSQVFDAVGALPALRAYDGYVNYLLPATLVNIALTTAVGTGVGVLTEIYSGFAARLRALPVHPLSPLVARTVADAVRLTAQLLVATLAAVPLLGFRPHGVGGLVAALAVTVALGWAASWLFLALATWRGRPETLQAVSFVVMFPLMFGSSAYVPVEAMPGWLRAFSEVNPVTYAVDAARALALGHPAAGPTAAALGTDALLATLGGLMAARNVRRSRGQQ
ncbi:MULTISPECIES: ABC transporter permease [unclassified Saccharothrix]|uniref:ABC transporter permease n=1 Tax=unclassified Saccharothrix TaxID=2593673 RepID=UPI00307F9DB6